MRTSNPIMFRGEPVLTQKEVDLLKQFFEQNVSRVEHLVTPDEGSSVVGNGIYGYTTMTRPPYIRRARTLKSGRKIKARKVQPRPIVIKTLLWPNIWTQAEQEEALVALMNMAKGMFPDLDEVIFYEPGRMD